MKREIQKIISEISTLHNNVKAYENNLERVGTAWVENLSKNLEQKSEESFINASISELTSLNHSFQYRYHLKFIPLPVERSVY